MMKTTQQVESAVVDPTEIDWNANINYKKKGCR